MTPLAPGVPPLDPSAPAARQWLTDELSRPEYQAAKPTWFDVASRAVQEWLQSIQAPGGDVRGILLAGVVVLVVGLLVAAFLLVGVPRLGRRVPRSRAVAADTVRSAADFRAAAARAAADGDWTEAVEELFRALARGLAERTILTLGPGTTAHEVAVRAAAAFPAERARLDAAAAAFDTVRYVGRAGTESAYRDLEALEADVRGTRPVLAERTAS